MGIFSNLANLFSGLKKLPIADVAAKLKSFKSGVSSFDNIIHNLRVTSKNGQLVLGDKFLSPSQLKRLAKSGNLDLFTDGLGNASKFPSDVKQAFKVDSLAYPESALDTLSKNTAKHVKINPDLMVKASDLANPDLLAKGTKLKMDNIFKNIKIKALAKNAVIIAGVVAIIAIGVNMYNNLMESTNNRNGCFLSVTKNRKTTSGKIAEYSCAYPEGENMITDHPNATNPLLFLIQALQTEPPQGKEKFKEIMGMDAIQENIDKIFADEKLFAKFVEEIYTTNYKIIAPCTKTHALLGSEAPICIMCDPSQSIKSANLFDTDEDLPNNFAFSCITTSNILETLTDIAVDLGEDIFGSVFGGFPIKTVLIAVGIIFIVLLLLPLVLRLFKSKPKT